MRAVSREAAFFIYYNSPTTIFLFCTRVKLL